MEETEEEERRSKQMCQRIELESIGDEDETVGG